MWRQWLQEYCAICGAGVGGFMGHVWSQQLVGTECLSVSVEPAPQIAGSRCSFPGQQGLWYPLCRENASASNQER